MSEANLNLCVNCQAPVHDKFCSFCGEKKFNQDLLSYQKLLKQLVESLTDIDGRVICSFRLLLLKPGQLVNDYSNGIRKNRLNPFQIFVLANIVYFLALSLTGQNTFNTPLEVHLNATNFFHRELAIEWVNQYVRASELTYDEYRELFNQKIELQSKTLIILIIPIFAMMLIPLFFKQKFIGVKALILSTHFFAFVLIFQLAYALSVSNLIALLENYLDFELRGLVNTEWFNSFALLLGLLAYLYFTIKRVFIGDWWSHLLKTLLLGVGIYYSILLYRSLLFFITYYSVST